MERYDFNAASGHLYNFVYDDFCSNYLEMSKVALNSGDEAKKNATYYTLLKCLKGIVLLIYPYTPFIAEELYLNLPNHLDSIMLESYPKVEKELLDDSYDKEIGLLLDMIKEVRNYKITNKIAPNFCLDLSLYLKLDVDEEFLTYLKRFTFSNVSISNKPLLSDKGELINLNYADMLISSNANIEDIIAKLEKDIALERSEIERCERMLSNPNFIAKAPKEKVEQEQAKLDLHKKNLEGLFLFNLFFWCFSDEVRI